MEALQRHLDHHPLVADTVSIVDYLKQMHRAMHGDDDAHYRLPDDPELIAQYFLLYASLGDPSEFDHLIDYDYRLANVRVTMKSDYYAQLRQVIDYARSYLGETFAGDDLQGQPTGRAYLNYVWMGQLAQAQTFSVLLALTLVLAMASLSFRSPAVGLATLLPVAITVLGIYAYMGFTGLWLSVSTTMFAAIAIGLGIDFAIHTAERLRHSLAAEGCDPAGAITRLYPETGRALLFNFLALALGFGVLVLSKVTVLIEFGITVALAITLSFLTSLLLLPALAVVAPRLLGSPAAARPDTPQKGGKPTS
jgi:predicted RND superfamily exporter protein